MAMSGGLDSSVSAILLREQGYDLVGITMKTWDYASSGGSRKETGCCSLDSINDARILAVNLGFPHYVLDLREEFQEHIISNFIDEYMHGRTPNPCVLCNSYVKWDALLKKADQLKCDYIATGHYAAVREENGRYVLSKGIDSKKDQSYVLYGISQENLGRTLLPLGGYHKSEIREIAKDRGFEFLANKSESFEICFIPDNDYRGFLKRNVENLETEVAGGDFVDKEGNVLGQHKGYPFYTIGQRKGLEIALGEPAYVSQIDADTNTVVIGKRDDLLTNHLQIKDVNFVKYNLIDPDQELMIKIRYHDSGVKCKVKQIGSSLLMVELLSPASAVTPGQSAVIYEGNDVVAGGIIV